MSFRDDWTKEKERKRLERDVSQFQRRMSQPIARGEVMQFGELQIQHLASLALAIEALEDILVGRGVLEQDELMDTMKLMATHKAEQVAAAQAVATEPQSSLICSV